MRWVLPVVVAVLLAVGIAADVWIGYRVVQTLLHADAVDVKG